MMPLRAWQFAAGALVWLMFARTPPASRSVTRTAPGLGLLGLALIVACGLLLDAQRAYPGAWALLPTMGAVLVVLAGSLPGGQRGAGALLSLPPLQWLGRISYSWYLWHWPVLLLLSLIHILFLPGLPGAFVFDDIPNIVNNDSIPVSYTHLDVYKRQFFLRSMLNNIQQTHL